MITLQRIQEYRSDTFGITPKYRVRTKEGAVDFVNRLGYLFFWPIKGMILPSLWMSVSGDRPVPNEHDDPGHITWDWKDSLLGKHVWYYAKILRKKATIISMGIAPYFYALSENFSSPDEDYLTMYEQGRMTQEAKAVYEALLDFSPMDTITLRKAAHLTSTYSDNRFNRALSDLQADFKIMPVGVTEAGAWHYSFAYDIVARHEPSLLEAARYIGEMDARRKIIELYFASVGAAQSRDLTKLFGWKLGEFDVVIKQLIDEEVIVDQPQIEGIGGEWMVLSKLI